MSDLRTAAQRMLAAVEDSGHKADVTAAADDLRAALAQQAEPQGCATEEDCTKQPWCRIRGECQRKQDEPRNQCGETCERAKLCATYAQALAQQDEPDLSRCPQCNGPADNGFDRSIPPSPYLCTKCMAEPVTEDMKSAVRWAPSSAYWSQRLREFFGPDAREGIDALERRLAKAQQAEPLNLRDPAVQKRLATQWGYVPAAQAEPVQEPVAWRWGYRSVTTGEMDWRGYVEIAAHPNLRSPEIIIEPLYTRIAPPQRKPLTAQQLDGVIERHVGGSEITDDEYASMEQFARAVEKAVWEKNHGQA